MNYTQAQQYLKSFINHEIHLDQIKSSAFKLQRTENLLKNLGNPQNGLKIIHVAGSKGKGSICALAANILKSSGYRVGLFTSPHVNCFRERIRVLKEEQSPANADDIFPDMISEKEFSDCLEEIKPLIEQARIEGGNGRLSFFEVTTALALYYFRKQQVDFVVLEAGLGGRLDATNAAGSLIAVVAPISLEHTNILGNTIGDIAGEKAAIIKDHKQKVIIASQEKEAHEVLKKRCALFNIDPVWVDKQAESVLIAENINGQVIDLSTEKARYKKLSLPLLGAHQRDNCAVAVSVAECLNDLGYEISLDAIREGVKKVFWPLRFEIISEKPLVVLDGAHNEASAKVLAGLTKKIFNDKQVTLIFGISKDKNKESVLNELKNIAKNIIFTKADHPRAGDLPGALGVKQALDLAYQKSDYDNVILVTGSMFVASEARQYLMDTMLCTN